MALGFSKQRGGDLVKFGFYWNVARWEAQIVPAEGGQLKGSAETKYVRMPLLALLIVAPLMGAAYAMFLPFIGFVMVLMALTGRLKAGTTTPPPAEEGAEELALAGTAASKESSAPEHKRAA